MLEGNLGIPPSPSLFRRDRDSLAQVMLFAQSHFAATFHVTFLLRRILSPSSNPKKPTSLSVLQTESVVWQVQS